MTPQTNPRVIPLQGVRNFRDFGGYATAEGTVRRGVLFRSGHFSEATDGDRARIAETGLSLVVDLRRPMERGPQPNRLDGLGVTTLQSDKGDREVAPHIEFLTTTDLSASAVHAWMVGTYHRLPYEEQHIELYAETFARLADGEGPVVVHCAAGKDRTGILCALILMALGVDQDTVHADYMATNTAFDRAARVPMARTMIEAQIGKPMSDEAMMAFMGVEQAYLDAAWAEIGRVDGGVEGYFDRLGVDDDRIAALRARLIIPHHA